MSVEVEVIVTELEENTKMYTGDVTFIKFISSLITVFPVSQ